MSLKLAREPIVADRSISDGARVTTKTFPDSSDRGLATRERRHDVESDSKGGETPTSTGAFACPFLAWINSLYSLPVVLSVSLRRYMSA